MRSPAPTPWRRSGLPTSSCPGLALPSSPPPPAWPIPNGPTAAYGRIKAMINAAQFDRFNDGIQNEIFYQGECEETEDHKRAVLAFFEKKKPEFIGK